jgi:hypothetical protein
MLVLGIWIVVPAGRTMTKLGGGEAPDESLYARMLENHETLDRTDRNRVHGRSFFFDPAQPPRPRPPEPQGACCMDEDCSMLMRSECSDAGGSFKGANLQCTDTLCEPEEIAPPPPVTEPAGPRRYAGPDLIMVWGSDAIFKKNDDLLIIPLGHMLDDVEVLALDAPRTVTVNWRGGGPFELDLYPADELPASNSTVTDSLFQGRDRPHVEDDRPSLHAPPVARAESSQP